jgi:disulfide bond formation protein DsbB
MTSSPDRRVAFIVLVIAALALAVAFASQHFLGMAPCELCLWERWPYRVLMALGAVALVVPDGARRVLLWAAALTLLCGAAIAFLHVGVERHWWPSPLPECAASNLVTGSIGSLIASLPTTPAKPCDAPNYLIAGLPVSFATMDLIAAGVCAGLLTAYLLLGKTTTGRDRMRRA